MILPHVTIRFPILRQKVYYAFLFLFLGISSCTPPSMLGPVVDQNFVNIRSYSQNVDRSLLLTEAILNSWLEARLNIRRAQMVNELAKLAGKSESEVNQLLDKRLEKFKEVLERIAKLSYLEDDASKGELKVQNAARDQMGKADPIANDLARNLVDRKIVVLDAQYVEAIQNNPSMNRQERVRLKNEVVKKYSYILSAENEGTTLMEAFRNMRAKIEEQRNIALKHSVAMAEYAQAKPSLDELSKVFSREDVQGSLAEIVKKTLGEKEAQIALAILDELKEGGK
jgi:hypothetical protein